MIIPFTYNILKRHPALMCMIHRLPVEDENDGISTGAFLDSFLLHFGHILIFP